MPVPDSYNIRNHEILMKKYYSSAASQEKLCLKIEKYKQEMKDLDRKMQDLSKYRTTTMCNSCDIETLPIKALICTKIDCDYRCKKPVDSLMPILNPKIPTKTSTKLVFNSDMS